MSTPPAPGASRTRTRLAAAAVLIVLVAAAGFAATRYLTAQERAETLARLPEKPALAASTQALAPLLDATVQRALDAPTADHVGQLGKVYQANYFYDEASACYSRAMELDPKNPQWPYYLAYLADMKGDTGRGGALLDRTIELDPAYLPARLRRADNRYKTGDHVGAKADYEAALDLNMANAYANLGLGRIAADAGDWATAEKHLKMVLNANGEFGTAYRLLATVYENLGQEEEQQRAANAAESLRRFEASPDPWVDELDQFCFHTEKLLTTASRAEADRDWDKALAYYSRVLSIEPDNFVGNAKLGALLQKMDRFAEAAPLLERALTMPARSDIRISTIHLNLGNNYYFQGAPDKAVPHYLKALELDPSIESAHHGLASCYLQLDRPNDVIVHCQKALALRPDSHEAQYNWGQALLKLNDVEGALPHFAEAARVDPSLPSADYKAGSYYYEQGDRAMAAPYLERALEAARTANNTALAARIQSMLGQ